MVFIFISIMAVLPFRATPFFLEAVEVDTGDPVDLTNPIDIGQQAVPASIPSTKGLWPKGGGVVLYDDPRDEARRREGVVNNDKRTKTFWVDNANDSRRRRIDRKLIDNGPYPSILVVEFDDRRERDRIHHSRPINGHQDLGPINHQGLGEDLINRRIQKEREEEINREVHNAIRAREKILENIIIKKRRNLDREKHTLEDRRQPLMIPLERKIDRTFANRRGKFDSSLERQEQERRNRLSQIANEQRNIRNIDTDERFKRDRERRIREEELGRILEEEKLRQIEMQREAEILNEKRLGINSNPIHKRDFNIPSKPPILIYEKVPVPILAKVEDNHRFSKPYEGTDEDYDDYFLDRRPQQPDRIHDDVQVKEEFVVEDLPTLLPLAIHGANPVFSIDPAIEADLALTANIVAASELEALNAVAIADISTLAQLQQAAAIANINHINAINNQVALSQLHDAAAFSAAKVIGHAAEAAAVAGHAAEAAAVAGHTAVQTAVVVDDQIAKAQKVDFLNLVFKHGLRNALREQLKLHLHSKLEEEEFIHDLQITKEDLMLRLLLLRPYFKSPSQAGFIVPAFIPNIPVGFDTTHEIANLPKIALLPTTLLAPDFRLPPEIADDLQNKIDIAFVEHILRLPENIFQNVIHLQKKDFIITLFPTLFRETVKYLKYDPVKHYEPNIPHSDIVKEHHHHHLHIHTPPEDKKPNHLHHIPPQKDYIPPFGTPVQIHDGLVPNVVHPAIGGKIQSEVGNPHIHNLPISPFSFLHDGIKGDPFIHHPPVSLPHDGLNDLNIHHPLVNALDYLHGGLKKDHHIHHPVNTQVIFNEHDISPVEPHREVHVVRHPVHSSISLSIPHHPISHTDHPRLKVPQGGGIPFKPRPKLPFPLGSSLPLEVSSTYVDYNSRENSIFFKNSHGRENSGESSTLSSRPIKSSGEAFPPLISPHPVKGISVRHKGEEGHEIITTPTSFISTTLIDEEREKSIKFPTSHERLQFKQLTSNGFRSVHLNSKNIGSTIHPLDSNEIGHSTLRPKKIDISNDDNESNTQPSVSSTTFASNNPTTTLHPFFSTFNNIDADIDIHNEADEEDQAIEVLASKESFTSTISPFANTIMPGVSLFKGFSGNVRQKPASERVHQDTQLENSLNWVPGTDINDDSHLASFFQKKTGNATNVHQETVDNDNQLLSANIFQNAHSPESVVDKVKRITNFFGTRLQEMPNINFRNESHSSINPFFHSNFNTVNDHIKSSSPIISAKHSFHSPDIEQSFLQDFEFLKIGKLDRNDLRSQIENSNSKVPMPRRIEFNTPLLNTKLHTKRLTNPSQGSFIGGHTSNGVQSNEDSRLHATATSNTFAGISVKGLENLPSFLREPPLCSNDGNVNRSFCTYPEEYESDKASHMVRTYEDKIREMLKAIDELPKTGPNLQAAAKQISNLNLSVSCETEERQIQLSWSRDILGSWLSILQTKPFEQYTAVTTCGEKAREKGCRPLLQPRPFVAFHPKDSTNKPFIMEFPLPVGCVYAES